MSNTEIDDANPGKRQSPIALVCVALERDSAEILKSAENRTSNVSRVGGQPSISSPDWPLDKQGLPMQFWAQVNFAELSSYYTPVDSCAAPLSGMLMLFVARDYAGYRAKDRGWYALRFVAESQSIAEQLSGNIVPEFTLRPIIAGGARPDHELFPASGERSFLACVMAAFHANGISFDEKRSQDPHYRHLVDAANDWLVVWKIAGPPLMNFAEKRELYICMRREDLQRLDFDKCAAVFL